MFIRSKIFALMAAAGAVAFVAQAQPASAEDAGKTVEVAQAEKAKKHPGRRIYMRKTCLACHGKDGRKAIQDYPNLAGQDKAYMIAQMEDILSGKRTASNDATGHPRTEGMRGALVTAEGEVRITDEEIKDVVDYLAGLEPAAPVVPDPPLAADRIKAGEKAYKKGKCQTCHGKDGKKPLKKYPYIAGQKKAYIINQMTDIRDKVRTNGKVKTMYPFVRKLKDDEIELLADYLSQIDRR